MKKHIILSTLFLSFIFLYACKQENKDASATGSNSAIAELEKGSRADIQGLWNLYKTTYSDGSDYMARDVERLEIKADNTYSSSNRNGHWMLTFGNDPSQVNTTLVILNLVQVGSNQNSIRSLIVSKTNDNGTEYLNLKNMENKSTDIYVRQK